MLHTDLTASNILVTCSDDCEMEVHLSDDTVIGISSLLLAYALKKKVEKTRRQGKVWVKEWKLRVHALLCDLTVTDREDY